MWERFKAFALGVWEFRSSVTTHFDDYLLLEVYDTGRDLAHAFTFRYWDN